MQHERIAAVERLVGLLEGARPMPLMRNRVRVDKQDADALLDVILGDGPPDHTSVDNNDLVAVAERVRRALQQARPVPLTYQVRLPPSEVLELADALRAAATMGA